MAEKLSVGLALLLAVGVVGGYMYLSGPHQQSQCPTISIATGAADPVQTERLTCRIHIVDTALEHY